MSYTNDSLAFLMISLVTVIIIVIGIMWYSLKSEIKKTSIPPAHKEIIG
jgi:hypothetical protein